MRPASYRCIAMTIKIASGVKLLNKKIKEKLQLQPRNLQQQTSSNQRC